MGERIMVNGRELNFNDLPPEPKEEYTVSVDGLGEITVTKGEPPERGNIVELYKAKMRPGADESRPAAR
jgi:hypothetical protein